jgi:hypothetical protein
MKAQYRLVEMRRERAEAERRAEVEKREKESQMREYSK